MDYWAYHTIGCGLGNRQVLAKTHGSCHRLRLDGYRGDRDIANSLAICILTRSQDKQSYLSE